jgi:hypothetical protein
VQGCSLVLLNDECEEAVHQIENAVLSGLRKNVCRDGPRMPPREGEVPSSGPDSRTSPWGRRSVLQLKCV